MVGRRGQAALLDAMLFLTVAVIVSASLISAFSSDGIEEDLDLRDYVGRAHFVALRSTLRAQENGSDRWTTVSDLATSYLLSLVLVDDLESYRPVLSEVERVFMGLTPTWAHFCWTVSWGDYQLVIGEAPISSEFIWPSIVIGEMPVLGGGLEFDLEMWS